MYSSTQCLGTYCIAMLPYSPKPPKGTENPGRAVKVSLGPGSVRESLIYINLSRATRGAKGEWAEMKMCVSSISYLHPNSGV